MKKISYNKLRNIRIKSIVVLGLSMMLTVFLVAALVLSKEVNSATLILFGFLYVAIAVPIMLMPFGNTLERLTNGNLESYFLVGSFQFVTSRYQNPVTFIIEPDDNGDQCIIMQHSGGEKFVVERYPDRAGAESRITEFQSLLIK
jgi:hypothetical protein